MSLDTKSFNIGVIYAAAQICRFDETKTAEDVLIEAGLGRLDVILAHEADEDDVKIIKEKVFGDKQVLRTMAEARSDLGL